MRVLTLPLSSLRALAERDGTRGEKTGKEDEKKKGEEEEIGSFALRMHDSDSKLFGMLSAFVLGAKFFLGQKKKSQPTHPSGISAHSMALHMATILTMRIKALMVDGNSVERLSLTDRQMEFSTL